MTQKSVQKNNRGAIKQPIANQPSLTHYQGPIPPPDILQGLDDLVPGTAAKLIQLALDESEHRRSLEIKVANANISAQQQQSEINELLQQIANQNQITHPQPQRNILSWYTVEMTIMLHFL